MHYSCPFNKAKCEYTHIVKRGQTFEFDLFAQTLYKNISRVSVRRNGWSNTARKGDGKIVWNVDLMTRRRDGY